MNKVFKDLVVGWVDRIYRAGWERGLRYARETTSVRRSMPADENLGGGLSDELIEELDAKLQPRQGMAERLLALERQVLRLDQELARQTAWRTEIRTMLVMALCDAKDFSGLISEVETVLRVTDVEPRTRDMRLDDCLVAELVSGSETSPHPVDLKMSHYLRPGPIKYFGPTTSKPGFGAGLGAPAVQFHNDWMTEHKYDGDKIKRSGEIAGLQGKITLPPGSLDDIKPIQPVQNQFLPQEILDRAIAASQELESKPAVDGGEDKQ